MSAKDNPAEIDRQKKNSSDKSAETDEKADSAAQTDPFEGSEGTMLDEIDTVMAGDRPLDNLDVSQVGPCAYRVLSARNGSVTVHRVDVNEVSCTCEDMDYNKKGNEVCAHVAKAFMAHPARMTPEEQSFQSLMLSAREYASLRDEAKGLMESLDKERIKQLSNGTSETDDSDDSQNVAGKGQPVSNPSGKSSGAPAVDPHDAADKLKEAYDDVIQDMQVEVENGDVWVQTGRNTPDTLPGPGNVQVFEAFLKNPSQVEYDPDAAESGQSPGQWWKNRIDPQDVDAYISEVLE